MRLRTTPLVKRASAGFLGVALTGLLLVQAAPLHGGEPAPGAKTLAVSPERAVLVGPDAVQQLVVDFRTSGRANDATRTVQYACSDGRVATVDATGLVIPRGDGEARITARLGDLTASCVIKVEAYQNPPAVNFANQIVPIFTKMGCNAGGCHGKALGQNGFRLSLLGFEPELDYETLVKEDRGRRLFPSAPEASLLLVKATAAKPHGGGKRLDPNSQEYRLIRRWIAMGMPTGTPTDPRVERITIHPESRVIERGGQQVMVTAHYTDGRVEDVTRWAQYQSNETDVAGVEPGGWVEKGRLAGQAAVMARYQGQVAVFRAIVPTGLTLAANQGFQAKNPIDAAVLAQWRALGVTPSPPCTDAEFLRRVSIDITGTLPTPAELGQFLADPAADKRARAVDRLLERPEYASYFALKWADVLRNRRDGQNNVQHGTFGFHDWIREQLARNTPYDQFAGAILAATGSVESSPPVQWYRTMRETSAFVDDTAQVFLGMRLQCARCHHHPFEKWSQNDYYGFAAFFARVQRKPDPRAERMGRTGEVVYTSRTGSVTHPKTGETMAPRGLGGEAVKTATGEDPRRALVAWLVDKRNPFFARALVNRYWAHFMGRGIVEPLDDMRLTNPASNPELLEALADSFTRSGYDLKALIRSICTSQVYGLSSVPNASSERDRQSFARHYPRRMSAEVLLDALATVSGVPSAFPGLPAGTRAIELPDESVRSSFLDVFGRPKRETSCECERVSDATLSQSLMLLNSADVQTVLASDQGRAAQLAKDARPEPAKIDELFLAAFGRRATPAESAAAVAYLAKNPKDKKRAYEDVIWALINSKEFQFID